MSKVYNDSNIYCPKADTHNTLEGFSLNSLERLAQLYFCPSCQIHKSVNDCSYNIESKFCPNCITDFTNTSNDVRHCTKSCFSCPGCTSGLGISISDEVLDGKPGKAFTFKCVYCEYIYQTGIITSPKSLHSIIISEKKASNQFFHQIAAALDSQSFSTTKTLDETQLKNLTLSNVQGIGKKSPSRFLDLNSSPDDESNPNKSLKFPIARKLTTKKSYKCLNCNTFLFLPHVDPEQLPTVNKFRAKFNAVEFMPSIKMTITVSPKILSEEPRQDKTFKVGHNYTYLINVLNPLSSDMDVHIATVPFIPPNFIQPSDKLSNGTENYKIQLTLPVADVTVKPVGSGKNLIKTIPTSCLSAKTTISRSELVLRLGSVLFKDQSHSTEPESLVAHGLGWSQIPITLSLEANESELAEELGKINGTFNVRIPLYITVQAELPEIIRKQKLSKKELSYGFWNIIDLGEIRVTE